MGILRAKVSTTKDGFWEIALLDLAISADGVDEVSMLQNLEELLISEYHFSLHFKQTPFVRLLRNPSDEVKRSWTEGSKSLRALNLPDDVRQAIAAVMRFDSPNFNLDTDPSRSVAA